MDYSLSGSSVHGVFQGRVLEWAAISFSRILHTEGSNPGLPHCRQMLLPLLFPSPGDLLDPGIKPLSPALQADSLPLSHLGNRVKPIFISLHDSISSNLYTAFTVLCYIYFFSSFPMGGVFTLFEDYFLS